MGMSTNEKSDRIEAARLAVQSGKVGQTPDEFNAMFDAIYGKLTEGQAAAEVAD